MKVYTWIAPIITILGISYGFSFKTISTDFIYEGKSYKVGDTVYGYKQYVKLVVGHADAPLLLGVPHDGVGLGVPEIPETGTTGRDINTLPLATKIAENFKQSTRKQAWIIINTIGRKRVDPNTYPEDAASRYKNQDAKLTYESYHQLMTAARNFVSKAHENGKGALLLDLHGHAHQYVTPQNYISVSGKSLSSKFIDQTELGYGISAYALSQGDAYLNTVADSSSIAAIARANAKVPFADIIRGKYSFGALLENENVNAVPSPTLKELDYNAELFGVDAKGNAKRRPYFNGGYCTRKYGTAKLGKDVGFNDNISAIQAETPGITVRNNKSIIEISSQRFNKAIINYLNKWYGYNYKI